MLLWPGKEYFTVGSQTLAKNHCPTDPGGQSYAGTPAPAHICTLWFAPFSANIMNYECGKSMTGFALMIYSLLQMVVMCTKSYAELIITVPEDVRNANGYNGEYTVAKFFRILEIYMLNKFKRMKLHVLKTDKTHAKRL